MRIVKPSAELLWITPDAAKMIERAGRVCSRSDKKIGDGTEQKFIAMLKKRGHLSVLEHASASFRFVCDRGVAHEMVRHRMASYSQESTRYCNYGKKRFGHEISVIEPPFDSNSTRKKWKKAMISAENSYLSLLNSGVSAEIARCVLPDSLRTEIVMTANFREWLHFFKLKCSKEAHPQMRQIATTARVLLQEEVPAVFNVSTTAGKGGPSAQRGRFEGVNTDLLFLCEVKPRIGLMVSSPDPEWHLKPPAIGGFESKCS